MPSMDSLLSQLAEYRPGFNLVATLSLVCLALYRRGPSSPRPPGPPGLPLVGNLLQLTDDSWNLFTKWKAAYGPIVHINLGGQEVVILNTFESAAELLEKISAIYSDRPSFLVARGILTEGLFITFVGYETLWRRMRRATQQTFRKDGVKAFWNIHQAEAAVLAKGLIESPAEWDSHFQRALASTLMSATYGTPMLKTHHDPAIASIDFPSLKPGAARDAWLKQFSATMAPWRLYGESKLGNIIVSNYFAKTHADVLVSCSLHPGSVRTDLQKHLPGWFQRLLDWALPGPAIGAYTQLWAGTTARPAEITGQYLVPYARIGTADPLAAGSALEKETIAYLEEHVKGF